MDTTSKVLITVWAIIFALYIALNLPCYKPLTDLINTKCVVEVRVIEKDPR